MKRGARKYQKHAGSIVMIAPTELVGILHFDNEVVNIGKYDIILVCEVHSVYTIVLVGNRIGHVSTSWLSGYTVRIQTGEK